MRLGVEAQHCAGRLIFQNPPAPGGWAAVSLVSTVWVLLLNLEPTAMTDTIIGYLLDGMFIISGASGALVCLLYMFWYLATNNGLNRPPRWVCKIFPLSRSWL